MKERYDFLRNLSILDVALAASKGDYLFWKGNASGRMAGSQERRHYCNRLFLNSLPEPDFRYFSNSMALVLS
jgi:hypothetical protein